MKQIYLFRMGIVLIVIGLIAMIPLYFVEIPSGNREMLSMSIGVVLGWGSMAVAYYYSRSISNKSMNNDNGKSNS